MEIEDAAAGGEADRSVVRFLQDRINEFNYDATGIRDGHDLALIVRGEDGEIVAGLYGWTWGGTCEIVYLWVHEGHRRDGLGTRLLKAAESAARSRGCRQVVVQTHSFQAPDFYRKFGYEAIATVQDYPKGHAHHGLWKTLG